MSGKVCVVIGATKGIGAATATRMVEHGANVVLTSRVAEQAETRAAELNAHFGEEKAIGLPFDLRDRASGPPLIARTVAKWNRIDTLVCNAEHIALGPLDELGAAMGLIGSSLEAHIRNYAPLSRSLVPVMQGQGGVTGVYI